MALELGHGGAALIFATSAIGVIPTAALMGRATEELADRLGPGIGGLLNVTFGNLPELLIAFFALLAGLQEVVKASIMGSILGNMLLVLGASMLVGGLGRDHQTFNSRAASAQATMLILASAALIMPAVFEVVDGRGSASAGGRDRGLLELGRARLPGGGHCAAARLRRRTVVLADLPSRSVQSARGRRLGGGRRRLAFRIAESSY